MYYATVTLDNGVIITMPPMAHDEAIAHPVLYQDAETGEWFGLDETGETEVSRVIRPIDMDDYDAMVAVYGVEALNDSPEWPSA